MNAWLGTLPTTAFRITVTLVLVTATAVRYLGWGEPAGGGWEGWLTFLAVMSGIDGAVAAVKRFTYKPSPPAGPDVEDAAAREPAQEPAGATIAPARASVPPAPVIGPQAGAQAAQAVRQRPPAVSARGRIVAPPEAVGDAP